jgi:acetyltransferase-like isoleucine patch superfamily enzyme
MRMLERLYRSPVGRALSMVARGYARLHRPFMVYGYHDVTSKTFRKYTRMSSTVTLMNKQNLAVGDHVWVGHYSILDATEGLVIEEGCQLAFRVSILTHGSETAIRLLGREFVSIPSAERRGYTRGAVRIGAYTYLGSASMILPGVSIGKGCLVGAGSIVSRDIPDYSIVAGQPGRVVGSTIDADAKQFEEYDYSETYYDAQALLRIRERFAADEEREF